MGQTLEAIHRRSLADPEGFWGEVARDLDWFKPWDTVLDRSGAPHFHRWFAGAECNTCWNALDRHVEAGRGARTALIYDSPITGRKKTFSYAALTDKVARFAGALAANGVGRGDRVILYMPMVPQAVVAMLACARIGAIHSVVFGGFAPHELATRIDDATPKAIVTASCGIEPGRVVEYVPMVEAALAQARAPVETVILLQRAEHRVEPPRGWRDWADEMDKAAPAPCVPVKATDPLYILYTSGTTGRPKGVVRDNGGHMVALKWSMANIYDTHPGEVYWTASDVGWVVGHSYIVYAPLLQGCATVLFEGKPVGTPDAGVFWRVIEEHKVKTLFTAPTAFRAIKKEDPRASHLGKYDVGSLKALFLAGERCDPDTLNWAGDTLGVPVIDHWWQTETGWAIAANPLGLEKLPVKAGSPTRPMPGYDVRVLGTDGHPVSAGAMGAICIKLPLAPSCLPSLWNADQRFVDAYLAEYPGYYKTGDAGYLDEDGYVFVMSRTDDIINVAGHRLSTGAMEEVLANHPDVAECAVIGVADALKGQVPLGLLVLKSGVDRPEDAVVAEVVKMVRAEIGPVAAFKTATVVPRLPKTRSGKILRGTMVKIADGQEWKMPATIDDPAILEEIGARLRDAGYGEARETVT